MNTAAIEKIKECLAAQVPFYPLFGPEIAAFHITGAEDKYLEGVDNFEISEDGFSFIYDGVQIYLPLTALKGVSLDIYGGEDEGF